MRISVEFSNLSRLNRGIAVASPKFFYAGSYWTVGLSKSPHSYNRGSTFKLMLTKSKNKNEGFASYNEDNGDCIQVEHVEDAHVKFPNTLIAPIKHDFNGDSMKGAPEKVNEYDFGPAIDYYDDRREVYDYFTVYCAGANKIRTFSFKRMVHIDCTHNFGEWDELDNDIAYDRMGNLKLSIVLGLD
ncbi:unnamed protein product [Ambrosiozyma monospora]|uniref:Unnamed protein product n=1 Tax=Ambrosiozyma monospora TaxID=43982 RepID=A0ACB5T6T9_AMBMO|nr:unnamed protein product [Ambrosiozyma monospora]